MPSRLSIDLAATRRTPLVRNSWNHHTEPVRNPGVLCCLQFDVGNLIAQFAHEIHNGIHSETVFPHFPRIFHGDVPPESVGSGSLVIVVSEKLLTINDSRQLNPIQPCWCTEIGTGELENPCRFYKIILMFSFQAATAMQGPVYK